MCIQESKSIIKRVLLFLKVQNNHSHHIVHFSNIAGIFHRCLISQLSA